MRYQRYIILLMYIILRETCFLRDFFFSWRYNPRWVVFYSPLAGFTLLAFEVT